jgi:predicted ATPase/DNA-binding SARP family transcriptional activator
MAGKDCVEGSCRVEVLGPLRVLRHSPGGEVEQLERFYSPKAATLLALLALSLGRPQGREALVDQFWPELPPAAGRDNLSTLLSALRRHLEPTGVPRGAFLQADRQTVALNAATVTTDVGEWERLMRDATHTADISERAALLARATSLYRGEVLIGIYEEWAIQEQMRWAERHAEALEKWADALETMDERTAAWDATVRALAVDPLREESHRRKMRLLAAQGRPAAAMESYAALEKLLRNALDAPPAVETRRLAQQIRETPEQFVLSPALPSPLSPKTSPPASPATPEAAPEKENGRSAPPLPLSLTRLFGREEECHALEAMLTDPQGPRLITLLGPGGCGKTRLAVEVARRLAAKEMFNDHVYFAPLADLPIVALAPNTVGRALGLPPTTATEDGGGILDRIITALNTASASLLVLDNLEHLIVERGAAKGDLINTGIGVLVRLLLERCPRLRILTTSRRLLGLGGEQTFPVAPLDSPLPENDHNPAEVLSAPAVALFADRARAARPDFTITAANAADVAAICRRMEGVPLAIEIAAAWARSLPPARLRERLEGSLDVLVSRRRDLPSRHQSVRAAVEWSYSLLEPELRGLFAALSVFRGGWSLEAAEAVTALSTDAGDVLEGLSGLEEQSLIIPLHDSATMEPRWRMLEPLREFAGEQLTARDEVRLLRDSHAAYFAREAKARHRTLIRSDEAPANRAWFNAEYDNLRTALTWLLETDASRAQLLCDHLLHYWEFAGHYAEGRRWCARALAAPDGQKPSFERGGALNTAATLAAEQGDMPAARALLEEAVAMHRKRPDAGSERGAALNNLANILLEQRDLDGAEALYYEALEISRRLGPLEHAAGNLLNLALISLRRDDLEALTERAQEGRSLAAASGSDYHLLYAEGLVGFAALRRGDLDGAEAGYGAQLTLSRRLGNGKQTAIVLGSLATVAHARGDVPRAARLFAAADALFERLQIPRYQGNAPNTPGPYDEIQTQRRTDPQGTIAAAWEEGAAWEDEHAASYALRHVS